MHTCVHLVYSAFKEENSIHPLSERRLSCRKTYGPMGYDPEHLMENLRATRRQKEKYDKSKIKKKETRQRQSPVFLQGL